MDIMLTPERIRKAGEFVEWLRQSVHEQALPANNRNRTAGACYAIAQDHHHAIVLLLENRLYASCFALLRLEFEAYVRGTWLALCANDIQIEKFISDPKWEPPKIDELLCTIEQTPGFSEKILSQIKSQSWHSMCAYTHTGGLHIQRWNTSDGIEPNYSPDEVEEVLSFSEIISALSVIGLAQLAANDEIAALVLAKIES
ncbi:MAG TPA: hypothetical protein DIS62_06950 [Candidatus Kerfeldbacteria bacterium]|nr:hypothetical protein [Candidatus Kerfeldbacteria bacterium]